GVCRLPLRPVQRRVHGNPVCPPHLACHDRREFAIRLGRLFGRSTRLDCVLSSHHPGLPARPGAAPLDHADEEWRVPLTADPPWGLTPRLRGLEAPSSI